MKYEEIEKEFNKKMKEEFDRTLELFNSKYSFKNVDISKLHGNTYTKRHEILKTIQPDLSNFHEATLDFTGDDMGDYDVNTERFLGYTLEHEVDAYCFDGELEIEDIDVFLQRNYFQIREYEEYKEIKHLRDMDFRNFICKKLTNLKGYSVFPFLLHCNILKLYKEDKIEFKDLVGDNSC